MFIGPVVTGYCHLINPGNLPFMNNNLKVDGVLVYINFLCLGIIKKIAHIHIPVTNRIRVIPQTVIENCLIVNGTLFNLQLGRQKLARIFTVPCPGDISEKVLFSLVNPDLQTDSPVGIMIQRVPGNPGIPVSERIVLGDDQFLVIGEIALQIF